MPYEYSNPKNPRAKAVSLPTWEEAQARAVAYAAAAKDAKASEEAARFTGLSQAWAAIALSQATKEEGSSLSRSVSRLS